MLHVVDKKYHNHSFYVTEGWGLTINSFTYEEKGFIYDWQLVNANGRVITGLTQQELIDALKNLIIEYGLKVRSESSKDILVIYTDNVNKANGFLQNIMTFNFTSYIEVLNLIEIRACWREDLEDAKSLAEWAQSTIDNFFIPNKKFYLTPAQASRHKVNRVADKELFDEISPDSYSWYSYLRQGYFGGLYYVKYDEFKCGYIWDDDMIGIDLISAYIWCLCCKKHVMSKPRKILNTKTWEKYIDNDELTSIGTYIIKYVNTSNKLKCYKNTSGKKLKRSMNDEDWITEEITFNAIDLKIFLLDCDKYEVECKWLYEFDLGYIPRETAEAILDDFIKKNKIEKGTYEYKTIKKLLNSHYGNACRKWLTRDEWKANYKKCLLPCYWGIWCTSYCKELVYSLGYLLGEDWRYSGVDSLYYKDTPENNAIVEQFNDAIREETKEFCKACDFDYEQFKNLGTFDAEYHITKFKEYKTNQYLFLSKEKGMVVKASGCDKKQLETDESLFDKDKIPGGIRISGDIKADHAECDIEDRHYVSDGYYYESEDDIDTAEGMFRYCLRWINSMLKRSAI